MKEFCKKFISKIGIVFSMALMAAILSCVSAYATDDFEIGTQNLNNSAQNSAKVGDRLLHPEIGWKRYDDTNTNISYKGSDWVYDDHNTLVLDAYKKGSHISGDHYGVDPYCAGNEQIQFNFTGKKIRIIGLDTSDNSWSTNIEIRIDDITYSFANKNKASGWQSNIFEKLDLSDNQHFVTITNKTTTQMNFDAIDVDENSEIKPYSQVIIPKTILNIEPEKTKIKRNESVAANLVIGNITNIAAEDIRIKYDAEKLQYVDCTEVDGIKLVKSDVKAGELRFILASKGAANVVTAKKMLLKLNFKGIKVGDALVAVVKGRISDGINTEKDLTDTDCGQATITIEDIKDVNNTGEFTLLDLAIDGRHLGEAPATLAQYNTDIVVNSAIDDADLLEIGNQILANPNYKF